MSVTANYRAKMDGYAARASQATGIPKEVILAQWALESGNGTSAKAVKNNNHAGIKLGQKAVAAGKDSGGFAIYANLDQFVQDYIRVMNLSYYSGVRAAGKTGDIKQTIIELGKSPYDAGHYQLGNVQGGKLLNMLGLGSGGSGKEENFTQAQCPACGASLRLESSQRS